MADRVEAALEAVRMREYADRAPHQLSLGQKRRVAIATVLAMEPSVLVLDEPSANLDPRTRRELMELLERLDRTLLIVTHDLPLAARLCERAVLLSAGRVVADEPALDLLADEQLLAAHDLELPEGYVLTPAISARLVSIPSSSFCIGTMKASMPSRRSCVGDVVEVDPGVGQGLQVGGGILGGGRAAHAALVARGVERRQPASC